MIRFLKQVAYATTPREEGIDSLDAVGTQGEMLSLAFAIISDADVDGLTLRGPAEADLHVVAVREQPGVGLERAAPLPVAELLLKDDRQSLRDWYGFWCGHVRHIVRRSLRPRRVFYEPPDVRLTGDVRMSLHAGVSRQIFVSVALASSDVNGTIEIVNGRGSAIASLPLHIEVLPFALVEPPQDRFLWYRGTLDCFRSQHYVPERLFRTQLEDIRRAGFTSVSLDERRSGNLRRALAIAREVGFRGTIVIQPPYPVDIARIDFSGFDPVFYVGDEPDVDPGARLPELRRNVALARDCRARTMVSIVNARFAQELEGERIDIISVYLPRNPGVSRSYYWQSHLEKPAVHRALAGVYLWKSRAQGIAPYCYQHRPVPPSSPFDDFSLWDRTHPQMRQHMTTYPSRQGSIPTLQWRALADGINDLRWLVTVETMIELAKGSRSAEAARLAHDCRERLESVAARVDLERVNVLSAVAYEPWPGFGAEAFHDIREGLARDARALYDAMNR